MKTSAVTVLGVLIPSVFFVVACGDDPASAEVEEEDPIPAEVRFDSIWYISGGDYLQTGDKRFGMVLTNHGNEPGTFKIRVNLFRQVGDPPQYVETDPADVDGDYSEELVLTTPGLATGIIILTQPHNSAVYEETDSRAVRDLVP